MDTIPNRGNNLFKILRRECEQMFFSSKTMQEIIVQCLIFNSTIKCYCLSHEYNYTSPNHFFLCKFSVLLLKMDGAQEGEYSQTFKISCAATTVGFTNLCRKIWGKTAKVW